MKKFWFVMIDAQDSRGNQPLHTLPNVRHTTESNAKNEAQRLAHSNQGHRFIVLEAVAACEVQTVNWLKIEEEGPPF
jgi:hypothetical protein